MAWLAGVGQVRLVNACAKINTWISLDKRELLGVGIIETELRKVGIALRGCSRRTGVGVAGWSKRGTGMDSLS
jgi:hypothetical protein